MYRTPAERPRARLPLLDEVTVTTPCRESWNAMLGDACVRLCTRCSKNVYDLSAMSADEAESFLATHLDDEDTGVRLFRRPDRRVLTSECMQGAHRRHLRKVALGSAAGIAAVVAASIALASVRVPSGRNLPRAHARVDVKRLAAANFDDAANARPADDETRPATFRRPPGYDAYGDERLMGYGTPPVYPFPPSAELRPDATTVSSFGLPPDVAARIVLQHYGRARLCYEEGLVREPRLGGTVVVRLIVDEDGMVVGAQDGGSDLAEPATVRCFVRAFTNAVFPPPSPRGPVAVTHRIVLRPPP